MHICALQTFDPIRSDPYPRSNRIESFDPILISDRIEAILEKARSDRLPILLGSSDRQAGRVTPQT